VDYRWDPEKAASNLGKHGVDFADAVGVFEDEWALTIKEEHVEGEQRFATLGTDFLERCAGRGLYVSRWDDPFDIGPKGDSKRKKSI
jgi:hypothetical protein